MVRAPLHLRKTQSNLLLADRESAMHMLIPFGLRIGAASHLRHKKPACERIPRESWTMADDRCEEIPLVPRDDLYEEASLAPQVTSLPDEDKRRLEALLRELLRDNS